MAIAAAVDDLIPRLHSEPQTGGYWKGQSNATKPKVRQLVLDFLVEAFGSPAFYTGLVMKTVHEGLGISSGDWGVMERHAWQSLISLMCRLKNERKSSHSLTWSGKAPNWQSQRAEQRLRICPNGPQKSQ